MIRPITKRLALGLSFALLASFVSAQVAHRVPRGEVSGVELQIEGALVASRERPLRLSLVTFEVLGLDQLRRAPNANVNVYASFQPDRPIATATSDARGRAFIEASIPQSVRESFRAIIEVKSANQVRRRFEFPVEFRDPRSIEVHMHPDPVLPGSPVRIEGRVFDADLGKAYSGVPVVLQVAFAGRGNPGTIRLVSDATGSFNSSFVLPADLSQGNVSLSAEAFARNPVRAAANVSIGSRNAEPMLVSVSSESSIVAPRAAIPLEVVVRMPDGRPVEGATVRARPFAAREPVEVRTDARGHARLVHRVDGVIGDRELVVEIEKAGVGRAIGRTTLRSATARYAARLSFEGGRFATALGGRAYARVVTADGLPVSAGVPVRFRGPRIRGGEMRASTNAEGVAMVELAIASAVDETNDRCGGRTATEIVAMIGEGAEEEFARASSCLLLDPDASLRIRARSSRVRAGASLGVELARAPLAARAEVVVELVSLPSDSSGSARVFSSVLVPAGATEASLAVPADAVGELLVRARFLSGDRALETRGASTLVLAETQPIFGIRASYDRATSALEISFAGEPGESALISALALSYEDARVLVSENDSLLEPTADELSIGDSWLEARLAEKVPEDALAAYAYLDGALSARPDVEGDARRIRDPYRARERFVTGRLALLFRALEDFVEAKIPGDEAVVFHREGARFVLNDAVLSAVASTRSLGAEGATGLGGEPITAAQLRALDPSFDYDAVARRVTRERLFRLLVSLRSFVNERGFDLDWARPGDPRAWLNKMVEDGSEHAEARTLVDGWGRPFQLVPTSRPRFAMLSSVSGFELVSAGPDGRFGNGDDIFDPTARVLQSASVYARSVGEDALVARLRGVSLSRATMEEVANYFGVEPIQYGMERVHEDGDVSELSAALPSILRVDDDPLAIRRVGRTTPSRVFGPFARGNGNVRIPLDLGTEPRSWGVLVSVRTPEGLMRTELVRATSGSAVLGQGELPTRARASEEYSFELAATNVSTTARQLSVRTRACDGATLRAPTTLELPAERAATMSLSLNASAIGRCALKVELFDGASLVASFSGTADIGSGEHPERRRVVALVSDTESSLDLAAPSGAKRVIGRLTLVDSSALVELPEFGAELADDPSLLAYSRVISGRGLDEGLRDVLLSSSVTTRDSLARVLALVALSSLPDDPRATAARDELLRSSSSFGSDRVVALEPRSGQLRMAAAVVGALAIMGAPDPELARVDDPLTNVIARLVPELRRTIREDVTSKTALAFPAAALLLVDSNDGHGRALYERALEASSLRDGRRSMPEVPGRDAGEALAAEAAMAVAANELGRRSESLEFARRAVSRLPALARAADDARFWLAALSVYGALTSEAQIEAEVSVGGRKQRVQLVDGRATIEVPIEAGRRTRISARALGRGSNFIAEAEVAYERAFAAQSDSPLRLSLEGDLGRASGVSALELVVSTEQAVFDPIVELSLPPNVVIDRALLETLRALAMVRSVEQRRDGFLRIALVPMNETTHRVPLVLRYHSAGSGSGFAASAYSATDAYRRTVLPPRNFELPR